MIILLLFFLTSCDSSSSSFSSLKIDGRSSPSLYQIEIPPLWEQIVTGETSDTMVPLAEFQYEGIKLTIHNFPGRKIPPEAQIQRWQRQLTSKGDLSKQSFSGFQGLMLEGEGLLAWALELAPCYRLKGEEGADVTLKFTGSPQAIEENRNEIIKIARSFEFVNDLPCTN